MKKAFSELQSYTKFRQIYTLMGTLLKKLDEYVGYIEVVCSCGKFQLRTDDRSARYAKVKFREAAYLLIPYSDQIDLSVLQLLEIAALVNVDIVDEIAEILSALTPEILQEISHKIIEGD